MNRGRWIGYLVAPITIGGALGALVGFLFRTFNDAGHGNDSEAPLVGGCIGATAGVLLPVVYSLLLKQPERTAGNAASRRTLYFLLIATAISVNTGRVFLVRSRDTYTPMLSANDRSRWCTIRALVDHGTYAIDAFVNERHPQKTNRRPWHTIDMVQHRGEDGRQHLYSSKPPLLPTLLAGPYWCLQTLTRATLAQHPFLVIRSLLIVFFVAPLILYFLLLAVIIEHYGTTHWGRVLVMACATWGTFLTTFSVTLNNHLPAAISVLIALVVILPVWRSNACPTWRFTVAGLFAAFAAANELPALSFLALFGAGLFLRARWQTCCAFLPAASLVAAGFFGTNYLAHGTWRPPYAHRGDGPVLTTLTEAFGNDPWGADLLPTARHRLAAVGRKISDGAQLLSTRQPRRRELYDPQSEQRFALVATAGGDIQIREWDHWYDYPDSYWQSSKRSLIDRGEPSHVIYALHVLIGHHGLISLTPIWLLACYGAWLWSGREQTTARRWFAALTITLTLVCLAFYVGRPLQDRNYGGVACGFRWMFWFTPLWLICLLPAADVMSRAAWRRWMTYLLLLVSIGSAGYGFFNPWQHPWLYALFWNGG